MSAIHPGSTSLIPGPSPLPVLGGYGNLLPFMRDPIAQMHSLHQRYGEIVGLAAGTPQIVFVFSPEYNQLVLGNTSLFYARDAKSLPIKVPENSPLSRLFAGLHQMNGVKHEQQRRLIMPAFHPQRIASYRDDIVVLVEQTLSNWQIGRSLNLCDELRQLMLKIAIKTRLGLDPAQEGAEIGYLLESWMNLVFSIPALLLPFNIPGLPYYRLLVTSERLEREIQAIIHHKRTSQTDQGDALSMLMQAHDENGTQLTDDELIGQTAALFVAGHDITTRVLTWTLFLLSQHPGVMADLLDELAGKLHGHAPTVEQLSQLQLLEWVIKESMRLLPPVLWWSRISTAPCQLGLYAIPQGAAIIVSHYITHRLPDVYPQPNKFLPQRWQNINPGPYEYIPFSAGPRMCPGTASAMLEMKLVLSMLLQRYHLTLPAKTRIDRSGLMLSAPKQGLPMIVELQRRQFRKNEVCGNILSLVDLG
ncbi:MULTISPECIES: cytochrome P450 [unclassified Tolypothrix]|uniref:cytochrome P450 n=1 Tax=unclassified Tolypothrix TaxID=2649714 RepID=UPI0007C4FF23|nr:MULTISPECIES: cytochrome P450 [unclassified Tolypothrix]MBE9080973.1 cytochrome P450 [Tolypothrix sp. LEGE 11397]UYD25398.1 cytochrome P450 [Tolypothrix sp. PCC 7712]UYD32358.1 cytochrome P450 [Tolypothrix sp. PCC 7601]BAY91339.1 cytochrome P450 [Microchaete diplosiphon NIES-3275]